MRIADDSMALVGQGSRGTDHGRRAMGSSGASFAQVLEGAKDASVFRSTQRSGCSGAV